VHLDFGHLVDPQHLVAVEVALLGSTRLDLDLAVIERAESEADATFHLCPDDIGIHGNAAVHCANDAMDFHLAVLLRYFRDLSD
jgi:hypothetical protein